jgi:hypothetical protein
MDTMVFGMEMILTVPKAHGEKRTLGSKARVMVFPHINNHGMPVTRRSSTTRAG